MIAFSVDGTVMPCHRMERPEDALGTVDRPDLSPKRQAYLKLSSHSILGCDTCVAKPVCGGGCRAVAVGAGLDLQTGAHPSYCLTTRAHARAVRRIYETLMAEGNKEFVAALGRPRALNPAMTEFVTR